MTEINMSQFLWAKSYEVGGVFSAATGPQQVQPNVNIFGLKSQEIKTANEKFTLRRARGNLFEPIRIPFQYIEKIPNWQKSASYSEDNVIGRYEPIPVYSHSNAQSIKVDLMYHAYSENNGDWSLRKIESEIIPKLKSLCFPQYDGRFSPPQPMVLNIGSHFIDVPVVIVDVNVEPHGPFEIDGLKAHGNKVSLDLRVAYPIYQAISQNLIIRAADNTIFAKKEFTLPAGIPFT